MSTAPFTDAAGIPVSEPTPVVTYTPVVMPVPGRSVPLQIKVSVPADGSDLPVILLSHGHGQANFISSLRGYGPLADFWAAHGFVVIQPTHLDSTALGLRDAIHPDAPLYLRSRAEDLRYILDHAGEIEAAVPGLAGRPDWSRVGAVGHSLGAQTVGLLCGQRLVDDTGTVVDLIDPRVKAGVLMGAPGQGEDLAAFASEHYPIMRTASFANMATPALVVAGENDWNPMFSDRRDWRVDAYTHSPGPKTLLTVFEAEHMFGGVSGYDAAETTDENPERVAGIRAIVWAYLRSQLYPGDPAWAAATAALETMSAPFATVDSK